MKKLLLIAIIAMFSSCIKGSKTDLKVWKLRTDDEGKCRYYIGEQYSDQDIYFIDTCDKYKIGDILK